MVRGERRNAPNVDVVPSKGGEIEYLPLEPTVVEDRIYVKMSIYIFKNWRRKRSGPESELTLSDSCSNGAE